MNSRDDDRRHSLGLAAAVVSSLLSSSAWIFQGEAVKTLTPLVVASAQGLLAGLVYLGAVCLTKEPVPIAVARHNWRDLMMFVFLRGFLGSILLCVALLYSGSLKVMFFTKLEPYFVLFWSWLLYRHTISRAHFWLLLVHVAGAVVLSTGGDFESTTDLVGDLLLITAVALLSYSYLYAARLTKELGSIHINGLSSILGGFMLLPFAVIFAPLSVWNPIQIGWAHVGALVLSFNVVSLTLWFYSLHHLPTWLVSALRAVGPVLAAPIAWWCFHQTLSPAQIVGAFIVLTTSAVLAYTRRVA